MLTVPSDTPACWATSLMLAAAMSSPIVSMKRLTLDQFPPLDKAEVGFYFGSTVYETFHDPAPVKKRASHEQPRPGPSRPCATSASRRPPGRSGTPAPGSRCSPSRVSRVTRTRRSPTPRRCSGSPGSRRRSRCTSHGTRSTTTPTWPSTRPTRASAIGTINANVFQDNDYMLGSVTNPDAAVRRKAIGAPARVRGHHGPHRLARPEALVLRRHQLPGPGRHPAPGRTGWPRRCRSPTTGSATASGCCWSTSCSSRPSTPWTCRTGAPRTCTA